MIPGLLDLADVATLHHLGLGSGWYINTGGAGRNNRGGRKPYIRKKLSSASPLVIARGGRKTEIYLHRLIALDFDFDRVIKTSADLIIIDHVNGDTLNNRRRNLNITTLSHNRRNRDLGVLERIFKQGNDAASSGRAREENPYCPIHQRQEYNAWFHGWNETGLQLEAVEWE
jgi:ribosome modulation factor